MIGRERVRYVQAGQGDPPVILLHGLYGSTDNWREIMRQLSGRFRLVALQFPIDRQPESQLPDIRRIDQLTEHVAALLDHLRLDKAVLCGNSLGGLVAIDFCLKHAERAEQLVLTGSAGLFEHNLYDGRIPRPTPEFVRERASEIFHDGRLVTNTLVREVQQALADRSYVRFLLRVARAARDRSLEIKDEIGRLTLPTLIIWGREDRITPPYVAEEFRTAIPNAELAFIDRCGHVPQMEHPAQFSRILHRFLKAPVRTYSAAATASVHG